MQMLVCQQCGAKVRWDGRSKLATCDHCGTQYVMHPQDRDCKYVASYRDAPTLCDITARHERDVDCSLLAHEDEADAVVQGLVEKIRSAVSQGNVSSWDISYCRRTYRALGRDG